jgi:magnesium-transporting ATPase (P-type)
VGTTIHDGVATDGTAATGLTEAEARNRLAAAGPNVLPAPPRPGIWLPLVRQLTHFFALMLWIAAALALVAGMAQLAVAIVIVVLVNGAFAFFQEHRADQAADRLRDLMPASVVVRRDGRRRTVAAADLVPGDLVILEAGDRISADLRVDRLESLAVDEALLTGESVPRRAETGDPLHAGTFVVEGAGEAVVVSTGTHTRLASIAALTRETHRPPSPLTVRLNRVVGIVAGAAVAVGTVFFGVALLLGMDPVEGFLLALGVTVALVPEGLLPTVTLSLARGAHTMAASNALVKRLEAVQTLGSVTVICTDKTGTLTRNEMTVAEIWTPLGSATVDGVGYEPVGTITATVPVRAAVAELAYAAVRASSGRLARRNGAWVASGDPMEVALHVLARRIGLDVTARERAEPATAWFPFDPRRLTASTRIGPDLYVKGAPESILARCGAPDGGAGTTDADAARAVARDMADRGLRVLAVARRGGLGPDCDRDRDERDLTLMGVVGLVDPPRGDAAGAVAACRKAGIRLMMITGDHPGTARAIATEVGLSTMDGPVVEGRDLPADDDALGRLVDHDGLVVARVSPEDKLRIARALQRRGHVVAILATASTTPPPCVRRTSAWRWARRAATSPVRPPTSCCWMTGSRPSSPPSNWDAPRLSTSVGS